MGDVESLFEFKFVIKQGNDLVRWEEGHNHIYDHNKLTARMKQPEVLKQIEESNFEEIEVATDRDKISYNKRTKVFAFHTLWQCNWWDNVALSLDKSDSSLNK